MSTITLILKANNAKETIAAIRSEMISLKGAADDTSKHASGTLSAIGESAKSAAAKITAGVDTIKSAGRELGDVSGFNAMKEALGGSVDIMQRAVVEAVHLRDEYVSLSNAAQKFVDSTHSADDVLAENLALSKDLHGSLHEALELTDAVRDGTDEMNLTMTEQNQLIRDIGNAVVGSGGALSDTEKIMSKLTFAFAQGSISGRDLRSIMRSYPDIGAEFVKSMGHDRKELIALADQGKITGDLMQKAFRDMGDSMAEKVAKKSETTGQMLGHMKDEATLAIGKFVEGTGVVQTFGTVMSDLGSVLKTVFGFLGDVGSVLGMIRDVAKPVGDAISFLVSPLKQIKTIGGYLVDAVGLGGPDEDKMNASLKRVKGLFEEFDKVDALTKDYSRLREEVMRGGEQDVYQGYVLGANKMFTAAERADKTRKMYEAQIKALLESVKADKMAIEGYNEVLNTSSDAHELVTNMEYKHNAELRIAAAQNEATRVAAEAYKHSLDDLNPSIGGVTRKLEAMNKQTKDAKDLLMSSQTVFSKAAAAGRTVGVGPFQVPDVSTTFNKNPAGDFALLKFNVADPYKVATNSGMLYTQVARQAEKEQLEVIKLTEAGGEAAAKYYERQNTLNHAIEDANIAYERGIIPAAERNRQITDAYAAMGSKLSVEQELLKSIRQPAKEFNEGMLAANHLFAIGKINAGEYADAVKKIEGAYFGVSVAAKLLTDQLEGIREEGARTAAAGARGASVGAGDIHIPGDDEDSPLDWMFGKSSQQNYMDRSPGREAQRVAQDMFEAAQERQRAADAASARADQQPEQLEASAAAWDKIREATMKWRLELQAAGQSVQGQLASGVVNGFNQINQQINVAAQATTVLTSGFNSVSTAITDLVTKGTTDWKSMIRSMLAELTKLTLFSGLRALFGGGGDTSKVSSAVSNSMSTISGLVGFASGGMILPGRGGGTDSQVVAFRKSPDETVRVHTPAQEAAFTGGSAQGGGAPMVTNVHVQIGHEAVIRALDTPEGRDHIVRLIATSAPQLRSLLGK